MDLFDPNDASFFFADDVGDVREFLGRFANLSRIDAVAFVDPDTGERVPVPLPLAEAFRSVASVMDFDRVAMVVPLTNTAPLELVTDELGIELETLIEPVADGEIPSTLDDFGRHQVVVADVLRWRNRRNAIIDAYSAELATEILEDERRREDEMRAQGPSE